MGPREGNCVIQDWGEKQSNQLVWVLKLKVLNPGDPLSLMITLDKLEARTGVTNAGHPGRGPLGG